jgi:glycosyltransferase involved in cell wall biosynthesis
MITYDGRKETIYNSIISFLRQDYPCKELIIIHDSDDNFNEYLVNMCYQYDNININQEHKSNLGNLRNIAIEHSTGSVLCQWDDDDYSQYDRLSYQYNNMCMSNVNASYLSSAIYNINGKHCYISLHKAISIHGHVRCVGSLIENTLMVRKNHIGIISYPNLCKGEDSIVNSRIINSYDYIAIDNHDYPYVFYISFNGNNTWDIDHHNSIMDMKRYKCDEHIENMNNVIDEINSITYHPDRVS